MAKSDKSFTETIKEKPLLTAAVVTALLTALTGIGAFVLKKKRGGKEVNPVVYAALFFLFLTVIFLIIHYSMKEGKDEE